MPNEMDLDKEDPEIAGSGAGYAILKRVAWGDASTGDSIPGNNRGTCRIPGFWRSALRSLVVVLSIFFVAGVDLSCSSLRSSTAGVAPSRIALWKADLARWSQPADGGVDPRWGLPTRIRRIRDGAAMRFVPATRYWMGVSDSDERWVGADNSWPVREVELSPFYVDETEITSRRFSQFIAQTGYSATSEKLGGAWWFDWKRHVWRIGEGVTWKSMAFLGPDDKAEFTGELPQVLVSWTDAAAYANWAECALPTEAEFEFLLRDGAIGVNYPWGSGFPAGTFANVGSFEANAAGCVDPNGVAFRELRDGFAWIAPVGSYAPNRRGVYDVCGNVDEWCSGWYEGDGEAIEDPRSDQEIGTLRVVRGGGWDTRSPSSYRCANRVGYLPETCSESIGFRCVYRLGRSR
jgi:sulfatase modifying factor 1